MSLGRGYLRAAKAGRDHRSEVVATLRRGTDRPTHSWFFGRRTRYPMRIGRSDREPYPPDASHVDAWLAAFVGRPPRNSTPVARRGRKATGLFGASRVSEGAISWTGIEQHRSTGA